MVFKRPGNSRDDKSARSPRNTSKGDNAKRPSAPSRGRYTAKSDQEDNQKTFKKFDKAKPGDRKPFSARGEKSADRPKRDGAGKDFGDKKPYTGRPKKAGEFGDKKPYSGRSRSGAGDYGDKKPYSGRGKSFGSRPAGTDRPKRAYGADDRGRGNYNKPFDQEQELNESSENSGAPVRNLRSRKKTAEHKEKDNGLIRLNRYIANAGICSRRKADELIEAGVVSVNGEVVSELGFKVDPAKDVVRYNGETLKREKMVYVLLNKPKDYITTTDDPQERRTVMHLVEKASKERIYPVGRLDRNTTGLLLMTNDGDLADKLSHPRSNVVKLYQVELSKSLTQGDLNKLSFGLELEDGFIKPDSVSYVQGGSKREVGIQIHSGKNRIVRRIFEHLGYEVVKLDRVVYAGLTKKDLPRGRWRFLEEKEIIQLKHLL